MKIWIVSYYNDDAPFGNITVTAFDNYEAAYQMYEYECELGKHSTVDNDEVPIYKNYFKRWYNIKE